MSFSFEKVSITKGNCSKNKCLVIFTAFLFSPDFQNVFCENNEAHIFNKNLIKFVHRFFFKYQRGVVTRKLEIGGSTTSVAHWCACLCQQNSVMSSILNDCMSTCLITDSDIDLPSINAVVLKGLPKQLYELTSGFP